MAKEEAPAFQYYPKEYLSDAKVRAMSYTERGMYWELVSLMWGECQLPAAPEKLARILGIPPTVLKKHWPALAPCFRVVGDSIEHGRLELERRKQLENKAIRTAAGRRGGEAKARRRAEDLALLENGASKIVAKPSLPSPSPSPTPVKKEKTLTRARFDRFWVVYPRKVGKAEAEKVWTKVNPDDALTDTIIAAVVVQARGWDDPKFIPHARTWLFGRRWEDAAPKATRINGIEVQPDYRTADYECRHTPKCDSARIHQNALDMGRPEA
jgi:uncharacterized protein YdaU (DUF1376 family)